MKDRNIWLSWLVEQEKHGQLCCSGFKITKQESSRVQVPLLWIEELAQKYSWLHILRNPKHRPKDPFELVEFIEKLGKT